MTNSNRPFTTHDNRLKATCYSFHRETALRLQFSEFTGEDCWPERMNGPSEVKEGI